MSECKRAILPIPDPDPSTRAKSITTKSVVNEDLDDQAMLKKYKKEIDNLKKKLRYTSAGGDKDLEICQMINQVRFGQRWFQASFDAALCCLAGLRGCSTQFLILERSCRPLSHFFCEPARFLTRRDSKTCADGEPAGYQRQPDRGEECGGPEDQQTV